MSYPTEIILTKDQIDWMVKTSGEQTPRKAFRMFCRAMKKEAIHLEKMPILVDRLMTRVEKKE